MEVSEQQKIRSGWLTLSVVCLVSVLMSLNMNTLNIALPTLAREFDASPSQASWLLLSYMLTTCALVVAAGRITDIVGQRPMYLWGLGIFIVSGFACGLAPTIDVLIGLRVIQAGAAAVLLANGATLIHEAFPAAKLSHALGFYTASFSVANLIGPTLGGIVVEIGGWQWVFWFSLPVAVPAFIWGVLKLRVPDRAPERPSLDGAGNTILLVILVLATYGISRGSDVGWGDWTIFGPIVIALVLVPVLVVTERRASNPILDAAIIRSNGVGSIYMAGFLNGAARFPVIVVLGLYFQAVLEQDTVTAALHLLPMPIGMILTSTMLGQLAKRFSPRPLATAGSLIGFVGLILIFVSMVTTSLWLMIPGLLIIGAGTGVFMGSNTTALLVALPEKSIGVGNAVRLMLQNVGNLLSTAVALALIAGVLPVEQRAAVMQADSSALSDGAAADLAPGFTAALVFMLVLSVFGAASCIRGQRSDARARSLGERIASAAGRSPVAPVAATLDG